MQTTRKRYARNIRLTYKDIIMVKFGLQFITFVGILVHSGKTDMIIFTAEFIIFAKAGHVAND